MAVGGESPGASGRKGEGGDREGVGNGGRWGRTVGMSWGSQMLGVDG